MKYLLGARFDWRAAGSSFDAPLLTDVTDTNLGNVARGLRAALYPEQPLYFEYDQPAIRESICGQL